MALNQEQAEILKKLIRRRKTSKNCYDRLEVYKRFNKKAIDGLKKDGLIIVSRSGKKFDKIYIPNEKVKQAEEFVENNLSTVK